jgi:predicted transcriptional regulator
MSISGGALLFSMKFVGVLAPTKLLLPVLFLSWAAFGASIVCVILAMRAEQNAIIAAVKNTVLFRARACKRAARVSWQSGFRVLTGAEPRKCMASYSSLRDAINEAIKMQLKLPGDHQPCVKCSGKRRKEKSQINFKSSCRSVAWTWQACSKVRKGFSSAKTGPKYFKRSIAMLTKQKDKTRKTHMKQKPNPSGDANGEARPVKDIIEPAKTIASKVSVQAALNELQAWGVDWSPVTDQRGELLGAVSKNEMNRKVGGMGHDPKTEPVEAHMEKNNPYCLEDQTVAEAEQIMLDANVAEAPVVTREKLVVGTTSLEAIAQDKDREKPRTSEALLKSRR